MHGHSQTWVDDKIGVNGYGKHKVAFTSVCVATLKILMGYERRRNHTKPAGYRKSQCTWHITYLSAHSYMFPINLLMNRCWYISPSMVNQLWQNESMPGKFILSIDSHNGKYALVVAFSKLYSFSGTDYTEEHWSKSCISSSFQYWLNTNTNIH